jgi:anti-sigma28 factor (negative regulator of flagellin synthesis)
MRIDDLNGAPQAREAAKSDAVRPDSTRGTPPASRNADTDAVAISDLATALAPSDARIEALRLQVERGEYKVSANDIARGIMDEHTVS